MEHDPIPIEEPSGFNGKGTLVVGNGGGRCGSFATDALEELFGVREIPIRMCLCWRGMPGWKLSLSVDLHGLDKKSSVISYNYFCPCLDRGFDDPVKSSIHVEVYFARQKKDFEIDKILVEIAAKAAIN